MKVKQLLGIEDSTEQEQAVPDFCLPKCRVGLEYEWENCGNWPLPKKGNFKDEDLHGYPEYVREIAKYFEWHIDGSLRKNGIEFTFKAGFSGSKILRATSAMDEASRILGFQSTYRTSLHCHLDMQDTNFPADVEQLGAVYCIVEPFLYQFVGNNRNISNYCIPWYKHPQHFENFRDSIRKYYRPGSNQIVNSFNQHIGDKYAGLNCFSLGTFGTVEYRQAPVGMQRDKILTWINLLMRQKEWARNHPMTPVQVLERCNGMRPHTFLQEVFQSHYPDVVRMSRNVETDVWNGLETLYQYVACC